jgi:hypothetical protein
LNESFRHGKPQTATYPRDDNQLSHDETWRNFTLLKN